MGVLDKINGWLRHSTTTGIQLDELDAFRGWACLGVVMVHCLPDKAFIPYQKLQPGLFKGFFFLALNGGFGVSLFFFLSGFLLFLSFGKSWYEGRPEPGKLSFFKRRLLRIVPAYYANLALVLLLWQFVYSGYYYFVWDARDIGLHLLFLHSLWPQTSQSINIILWSLGVEINFYLVLPFMANWFYGRRALVTAPALIAASFVFKLVLLWAMPVDGKINAALPPFNQLVWCLDQFVVGICFAALWLYIKYKKPEAMNAFRGTLLAHGGFAAAAALLHLRLYQTDRYIFVFLNTLLAAGFGAIVLGTLYSPLKKLVANPAMQFFGIISYSAYLWHHQVLLNLELLFPSLKGQTLEVFFWRAAALPLIVLVSLGSYLAFERPFLKMRRAARAAPAAEPAEAGVAKR